MPFIPLSRYEYADLHADEDGNVFIDVPEKRVRGDLSKDVTVIADSGDDVFKIAWRVYRSTRDTTRGIRPTSFFDAICDANNILDPTAPIEAGTRIRVPSIRSLMNELRSPPYYSRESLRED